MRKAQKRQIEEIIRQIEEAHDEMKKCIEQGIAAQAQELLADCQNAAIAIGTMIEEAEGEGHSAVKALEEYCEQVYKMHEYLLSGCSVNANKIYKSLRQRLIKASNSIKNDIKIRKETVFLPYKASMWDSLESVWKAADADPDCDAYVIPIPYFDKNPDGSFKEEHYEGNLYPAYVPVTRYDAYDLEAEHPDEIYIHNPYDECNYVTSVHPYFYAKNLRNYTDKLIYIPYFILGEIEPDNQAAIDSMKHFCFTPGTIYAHQVIVQSENMRQIYINEYIKAAKKNGLGGEHVDRKLLEKKFLGTGSPKIDKVLRTNKEDLEIPQEWLNIIKKPDGSRKKIIFYNTSVGALLQHSEKMLAKMEWVFGIFKENKDEVALLWRPHPLIQATIESMRPQLWEKYREIKDKYIEEGWGIYDNASDVDRAMVLSDAYYGDASSVVQLCRKKGMPVLIQDVNVLSNNKDILLSTYGLVIIGNDIYFSAKNITGFFKYNRQTKKVKQIAITSFALNDIPYRFAFGGVCAYKGKVLFAPFVSSKALLYSNGNELSAKVIDFEKNGEGCASKNCYIKRVIVSNNLMYLVGDINVEMLILNMDTMKISVFNLWRKQLPAGIGDKNFIGVNTGGDVCVTGDSFWVPINCNNCILEVNMKTQKTNVYKIDTHKMRFTTICFDGRWFWLTGQEPIIVKWNREDNRAEILDTFPEGFQQFQKENYWTDLFSRTFYKNGYVYLFPLTANMVIKIETKTNHIEKIHQWNTLESCYTVEEWDENIFYVETGNNNYIDIDESMLMDINGEIMEREIFMFDPQKVKYNFGENSSGIYMETQAFTINRLLEAEQESGGESE